jgi:hypothetical protein
MSGLLLLIGLGLMAIGWMIATLQRVSREKRDQTNMSSLSIDHTRPSPDYNPTPAAEWWRSQNGLAPNVMLSAQDVGAGDLWAHTDCNVPPVDVIFGNPSPEWKGAFSKWPWQTYRAMNEGSNDEN